LLAPQLNPNRTGQLKKTLWVDGVDSN
jgi:hypothetical protein